MAEGVNDLLDDLRDLAEDEDTVSIGDVMDRIGDRSAGPFLLLPALIAMSPIGVVPSMPTLFAVIVIVFAGQVALGRDAFWMPGILRDRSVSDDKLKTAVEWSRTPAAFVDRWIGSRLEVLTTKPVKRVAALLCILLALCIPPLEVVPGASFLPLGGIFLFGLALTLRDGIVMLAGFLLSAAAFWAAWRFIPI